MRIFVDEEAKEVLAKIVDGAFRYYGSQAFYDFGGFMQSITMIPKEEKTKKEKKDNMPDKDSPRKVDS